MPLSKIVGLMIAAIVFAVASPIQGAGGGPPDPSRLNGEQLAGARLQPAGGQWELTATAQGLTSSVRVNSVTTGGQHFPTVTVGPGGQVYVAWVDCLSVQDCSPLDSPVKPDIYFAKSTDGGQHFSARVLVSDDGPGAFASAPKIATDQNGVIYIVWHDDRSATLTDDSFDVYLSKSTDGGVTFSPSVRVNEHIANAYQFEPDLAVTSAGTIYVSWERYFFDDQLQQWDSDIYVAKSTDGGASFGSNVKASDGTNRQYKSAIGVGPSGKVYVAWTDLRNDAAGDVYFGRSTDGGATFSPGIRVNSYTSRAQVYPEMAIDGNETIYVVWLDDRRNAENADDIYAARSTDLGLTFGSEVRVSDADLPADSVGTYLYPVISAAGNGLVAVAWYDERTGDWDTYMTRSSNAGVTYSPSWRVNDITTDSQLVPDIFMTSNGLVFCVYRDRRSGDFDIYFVLDTTTEANDTLTVARGGTGTGTVTSDPVGVNCGSTCSAQFRAGTGVTLTASADSGSVFAGWSGEGCSGTGTCNVTMIQTRFVTAMFTFCTVVLSNQTITTAESYTSCGTMTLGPALRVKTPGDVECRAANRVILRNGFSVGSGATFTAGIDPSLAP